MPLTRFIKYIKYDNCETCDAQDIELRPYGANGEWICWQCGMKDEEMSKRRFMQVVFKEGFDA